MKKFISILLVLIMLFSACSNVFADDSLTPERVKEEVLAYYDANEATIMSALKAAAGEYAGVLDLFDIRTSVLNYLNTNAEAICAYMIDICQSSANKEEKTSSIEQFIANSLIDLFNRMMPGAGDSLAANIKSFAASYAPVIVEQYKTQLNLATIVSDSPIFFAVFSLVELLVIIGLIIALGKKKNAAK